MKKNDLIRRFRLISNFVTSQAGQKIIAIHIRPNITRSKDNQTMKLGQSVEYNVRNIFSQKAFRKLRRETSSRPPFFKKALCKVKASGQHLSFNIFW